MPYRLTRHSTLPPPPPPDSTIASPSCQSLGHPCEGSEPQDVIGGGGGKEEKIILNLILNPVPIYFNISIMMSSFTQVSVAKIENCITLKQLSPTKEKAARGADG